jgi:hypothetical protein
MPFVQLFTPGTLVHQRYRINAITGQGNMGAVYEAVDTHTSAKKRLP